MRRFSVVASGLFACVTGCGDDGGVRTLPDAPVAGDAPIDTPATGSVNVTTYTRRYSDAAPMTPYANALVVVTRKDGSVTATANTSAQGTATVDVEEGSSVTAVYADQKSSRTFISTYVGVKPGDSLRFGDGYYSTESVAGTDGGFAINWAAVAGATYYYVYTPCDGRTYATQTAVSLSLWSYCQTPTAPIGLVAFDATDNIIASAYLPTATYTPGSTLTVAANQWVAQAAAPNYTLSVNSVHASVNYGYLYVDSYFGPRLNAYAGGGTGVDNNTLTRMLSVPSTATSQVAYAELQRSGSDARQFYYRAGASPAAFDASTLPWISGVILAPKQGAVQWLTSAGSSDAGALLMGWSRSDGKSTSNYEWNVIFPPGQQGFAYEIPTQLEAVLPDGTDNVSATLQFVDLSSAADYDAVRALPEWRVTSPAASVRGGDEPNVKYSTFDVGEGVTFD